MIIGGFKRNILSLPSNSQRPSEDQCLDPKFKAVGRQLAQTTLTDIDSETLFYLSNTMHADPVNQKSMEESKLL